MCIRDRLKAEGTSILLTTHYLDEAAQLGDRAAVIAGGTIAAMGLSLIHISEPTTGFDPEARREFWNLIRSLKAEGTTILLTTHYLDEAAQLGDRAGVILGGRLVEVGRVGELGGPEAREPIVRWREPDGTLRAERTDRPAELVASVVAAQAGREPEGLEVIRPSLEDIYLQLVHSAGAEAHDDEEALA